MAVEPGFHRLIETVLLKQAMKRPAANTQPLGGFFLVACYDSQCGKDSILVEVFTLSPRLRQLALIVHAVANFDGQSSGAKTVCVARAAARSMTCSNSRTLPGHVYRSSKSIASLR
jgi:hypothetical protein